MYDSSIPTPSLRAQGVLEGPYIDIVDWGAPYVRFVSFSENPSCVSGTAIWRFYVHLNYLIPGGS